MNFRIKSENWKVQYSIKREWNWKLKIEIRNWK